MSKSPKEIYAVPEWMRQFLPLFHNTGGNDVEELLHDEDTNMFANCVRYMLIVSARSQYALLMSMHSQGLAMQPILDEMVEALEARDKQIAELRAKDINVKQQAQALFDAIQNPDDAYIPAYVRCLRNALTGVAVEGE